MEYTTRSYDNPAHFLNDLLPIFKDQQVQNAMLLGLAHEFVTFSKDCLYQVAIFQKERLLASALLSRYLENFNLIVSTGVNAEMAPLLIDNVLRQGLPITGIVGERTSVNPCVNQFVKKGFSAKNLLEIGVYRCDEVILPAHSKTFQLRLATFKDTLIVASWIESFQAEATPHDGAIDGVKKAKDLIRKQQVYLLHAGSQPVSMAIKAREQSDFCAISTVFAPVSFRRRGYGGVVTAKLTERLLGEGKKFVTLNTDLKNTTANKIYQNIGYQIVCKSEHIGLKKN